MLDTTRATRADTIKEKRAGTLAEKKKAFERNGQPHINEYGMRRQARRVV
jgi:hypothetical protein